MGSQFYKSTMGAQLNSTQLDATESRADSGPGLDQIRRGDGHEVEGGYLGRPGQQHVALKLSVT